MKADVDQLLALKASYKEMTGKEWRAPSTSGAALKPAAEKAKPAAEKTKPKKEKSKETGAAAKGEAGDLKKQTR